MTEKHHQQYLESNQKVRRNSIIFFILTFLFQIATGLLYGFYIRPTPYSISQFPSASTLLPYLLNWVHSILAVVGFGLLLSFLRENIWSGLGFTFFITSMTIQEYFMVNALWSWAGLAEGNLKTNGAFIQEFPVDKNYYFFTMSDSSGGKFGNTLTQAFKASLSNIVAFSAIVGRGGPLEAWIITFFGTIGFELNRTILTKYGFDGAGTMSIFIYGGFVGLMVGLFLRLHQKQQGTKTSKNILYTANKFSATMSLLGTTFCFVAFPVLALDPPFPSANFTSYTAPLSIVFALASSTFTSMVFSQLFNNKLVIRDIIYGPIAGGVASATASFYITNPVYAILIGMVAGMVQVIGQNFIQKKWANENNIINTTSFILFGVQGLIGCFFAAAWNSVGQSTSSSTGFTYNVTSTDSSGNVFNGIDLPIWQLVIGLISAGFGIGFGGGIGMIIYMFAGHESADHFTDHTYWVDDDGICYQDQQAVSQPSQTPQLDFKQGNHQIKNTHAYL